MNDPLEDRLRERLPIAFAELEVPRPPLHRIAAQAAHRPLRGPGALGVALLALALIGGGAAFAAPASRDVVRDAFEKLTENQDQRDGPRIPPGQLRADTTTLLSGTRVVLWVSPPDLAHPAADTCIFVEVTEADGGHGGAGSCSSRGTSITVKRLLGADIGSIGRFTASRVVVSPTGGTVSTNVPVTNGYFLIPPTSGTRPSSYTIELRDENDKTTKVESNVSAPPK